MHCPFLQDSIASKLPSVFFATQKSLFAKLLARLERLLCVSHWLCCTVFFSDLSDPATLPFATQLKNHALGLPEESICFYNQVLVLHTHHIPTKQCFKVHSILQNHVEHPVLLLKYSSLSPKSMLIWNSIQLLVFQAIQLQNNAGAGETPIV